MIPIIIDYNQEKTHLVCHDEDGNPLFLLKISHSDEGSAVKFLCNGMAQGFEGQGIWQDVEPLLNGKWAYFKSPTGISGNAIAPYWAERADEYLYFSREDVITKPKLEELFDESPWESKHEGRYIPERYRIRNVWHSINEKEVAEAVRVLSRLKETTKRYARSLYLTSDSLGEVLIVAEDKWSDMD